MYERRRVGAKRFGTIVALGLVCGPGSWQVGKRLSEGIGTVRADTAPATTPETDAALLVTAEPSTTSRSAILLCMTNRRSVDFVLDAAALPWASRYSLILIGTRASGAGTEILKAGLPVSDSLPSPVTFKAGERRCGEVDVATRLPGFAQVQAKDEVLVFWAYTLMLGKPTDRPVVFGGMVKLKQRPAGG
jgi:hypothetical protein